MKTFLLICFVFLGSVAQANVVGVDSQNFNPTTSGLDFVTVESSKTLSPGVFNLGLFFNYAVNTLPHYEDIGTPGRFEQPQDSLVSMDFNLGFGIMNNWDMGISIPQIINQTVDAASTGFQGQFEQTGLTEVRLNTKYRVWDGLSQGIAVSAAMNLYMIENFPFTGTSPGPTYNLQVAYNNTIQLFTWGLNLGYRLRNPGAPVAGVPVQPFDDQYIASIAGSYYFPDYDFKVIAEIYGALPAKEVAFTSDRDQSVGELLIGGKFDLIYDIAAHAGFGTEIFHGTASPDWRVYAGLNWSFGPIFSSGEAAPPSDYILDEVPEETPEVALVAEPDFTYIDEPEAFSAPAPVNDEKFMAKNILFEFNGTGVRGDFHPYLKNLADYVLKGSGFKELIIIGHTDSVGADAYNLDLSQRRAQSVSEVIKTYLPEDQRMKLRALGEGERSPMATNRNYQGRALNRRVEFFVKRQGSTQLIPAGTLNSAGVMVPPGKAAAVTAPAAPPAPSAPKMAAPVAPPPAPAMQNAPAGAPPAPNASPATPPAPAAPTAPQIKKPAPQQVPVYPKPNKN